MNRYIKVFVAAVGFSSLVLSGSLSVYGQTLGFGGLQGKEDPQYELLSSLQGRFVFGQISDSSKDQFMLDTFTGRLWRIAESGEIGIFLRSVPYRRKDRKYLPLPKNLSEPESKKEKNE